MQMYLVLGDWSDDGHGKTDKILFEVNKTVEEVQQAYKDSCKLTGISFNHNEDYTGIKRHYMDQDKYHIASAYEDDYLSDEVLEVLNKFNCPVLDDLIEPFKQAHEEETEEDYNPDDWDDWRWLGKEEFIMLWWWFVSLSLPGVEWKEMKCTIPTINGYWNKNLNVQFGYGLYI